jgi:hypothetical protein
MLPSWMSKLGRWPLEIPYTTSGCSIPDHLDVVEPAQRVSEARLPRSRSDHAETVLLMRWEDGPGRQLIMEDVAKQYAQNTGRKVHTEEQALDQRILSTGV